jgi:hypothetical protein
MRLNRNSIIGVILLLLGFSFVLKLLFGIDLPVFRIAFALGFIYMGIRLVRGSSAGGVFSSRGHDAVAFGEADYEILEEDADEHTFSILFGKGSVDLSASSPAVETDPEIEINAVCSACFVYYNPTRPIRITAHSFLADAHLPDGSSTAMGTVHYRSPGLPPDGRCLRVRVNAGLSKVTFVPKNPPAPSNP